MSEEIKKLMIEATECATRIDTLLSVVDEKMKVVIESVCIDCGWSGAESEHHFLDGWHVCPKCHQAEFLVSGEELDEMNESEGVLF